MKIGIIKEGKIPVDKRVVLSPTACKEVIEKFPEVKIVIQPSQIRCYKDQEYVEAGFQLQDDVSDCDVLLGIKEVPISDLIPQKIYFFFSHTIKKQDYNRDLLVALLRNQIQLVDYEMLTDKKGQRVIAFGRFAGLVGAYNGILAFGKKNNLAEMKEECKKVELPPKKIVVTGGGRVAKGAMETLDAMGIRKVKPVEFLEQDFEEAVYVQLNSKSYHHRKDGGEFAYQHFYANPSEYNSSFLQYTKVADVLIAGAYWHPESPVLFTKEDMRSEDFSIRVIADITCDIEGSIPSTKKPSTIHDPIYDYNPETENLASSLSDKKNITVMAVDNLPNELPRDASDSFGRQLIDEVLPNLIDEDSADMIKDASITKGGKLTENYAYLQDFADGKE
jgi:saccharopine dehydrogenase (NAD+, L-lysine-forming)